MKPIAIDLFAGAGGMSLGFEQAGFEVAAAVEVDPIHACIHKYNFPECTVIPRSVSDLSGSDIREAAAIDGKVSLVFGGAPCQGFSMIGQRVLDDPRNSLVKDFVRLVSELDADYFVFENVKGLTVGRHRKFLDELIEEFETKGYSVRLPWAVLNAASFGVPQDRRRLFLLGAKKHLERPHYPLPTTFPAGKNPEIGLTRGPSCAEALQDIPNADDFSELLESDEVSAPADPPSSEYALEMRCLAKNAWHYGTPRKWEPKQLTSSIRTNHSTISQVRFDETAPGTVEPISRFFKLPPDGVSNTLRAGTDAARGAFTSPRPIHYTHPRCVTVREMARLHGFPDWFRFHQTKWHGARQIGNAVPPPLARAVANELARVMNIRRRVSRKTIKLGEPELLRLGMTEAAKYWGIEAPIQKRDRKSGARKRSQLETEAERLEKIRG